MVTAYPFDEGRRLRGEIFWMEPQDSLNYRRGSVILKMILYILVISLLIGIVIFTILFSTEEFICKWSSIAIFSILTCIIGLPVYYTKQEYQELTIGFIAKNGFSLGIGTKPFHLYSDVYYIEVGKTQKGGSPFTMIIFKDGTKISLASYPLMKNSDVIFRDEEYAKIRDKLRECLIPALRHGLEWDQEAEHFVIDNSRLAGPIFYATEKIAGKYHIKAIDIVFIDKHLIEITKVMPAYSGTFLRNAQQKLANVQTLIDYAQIK
jgi:hypothetical protein